MSDKILKNYEEDRKRRLYRMTLRSGDAYFFRGESMYEDIKTKMLACEEEEVFDRAFAVITVNNRLRWSNFVIRLSAIDVIKLMNEDFEDEEKFL